MSILARALPPTSRARRSAHAGRLAPRWWTQPAVVLSSRGVYIIWLTVAAVCIGAMWELPGDETIPYHIAWAGFALAFGARTWSNMEAWTGLWAFTLVTGAVLVARAASGVIAWQETAEIPLMSMLMALLVWNIRRRQNALATVTEMAHREAQRAHDRELLTRLTSHELRSPLTIASGYVQLMSAEALADTGGTRRHHLDIVQEELDRMARTTERLIRVIQLQGTPEREVVDLDGLIGELVSRWSGVANRRWVADSTAGRAYLCPERFQVCLDTLVENAVRYTTDGDVIRVESRRHGDSLSVGVGDSGPGLSSTMRRLLTDQAGVGGFGDPLEADGLSRTGLGLGLVRSVAVSRGGRLVVSMSPEGGAYVGFLIPDHSAGDTGQLPSPPHSHADGHREPPRDIRSGPANALRGAGGDKGGRPVGRRRDAPITAGPGRG